MEGNYDSYYAFKPVENPIYLDFSGCLYWSEVHQILKKKFGLPEYYGENWDALWDCLRDLFYKRGDWTVIIRGFMTMPDDLREECKKMLKVFEDVHKETPNVVFQIKS